MDPATDTTSTSTGTGTTVAWPEARTVRTHLGTLEYHDVGQGPVLLLVHLVLADATHWDRLVPLLADRYRLIMPTLPLGAHRIPADAGADLSIDGLARALDELLAHLGVDDVTIVGNDSGGAISQVVAAYHRERIGRVVLTNCDMYDAFPPRIFGYFKLLPRVPGATWLVGHVLRVRACWRLPFVFGRITNEVDAVKVRRWADALLAQRDVRRDVNAVIRHVGPDVTNDAASRLRSTDLPILVAWGADDRAFVPALAERFCEEVATAELVMIPDCKTLVCWDQPERLAELIAEFVPR